MSWFKMDDQFPNHPKVRRAGPDAAWLFVAGGCYCAQYLTNGKIPKEAVPALTAFPRVGKLAVRLVEVGLWHDHGDHYEVHDYLTYNPSREKVEAEREAARERSAKGGRSSGAVRAKQQRVSEVPSPTRTQREQDGARKRATKPPADFVPTDNHRTFAGAHGLDLERERTRWINDCEAKGRTYKVLNAGFTTWLDHAVDFGRGKKLEPVIAPAPAIEPPLSLVPDRPMIRCDTCHKLNIDCTCAIDRTVTPRFKAAMQRSP